jgi:hypothetical protein
MLAFASLALLAASAGLARSPATLDLASGALAGVPAQAETTTSEAPPAPSDAHGATYAASSDRWFEDKTIGWERFLTGLRGTEHFYNPVGNPLYFETPLNNTSARFLFLYHGFSDDSQLQGGQVNVAALQLRVALTERLGFIATKDGFGWLDTGIGIEDEGWNDVAAGLKYAFYVDHDEQLVVTGGARLMLQNFGEQKVLQGAVDELSPFVSFAKGWGKFHLMGNLTDRIPFDDDDGNNVLQWDVHTDYEVADGVAIVGELHGLHYLTDGTRLPLNVGGLDYSNFGSSNVEGSAVIWLGLGGRVKFNPHLSAGGTFEYPLTNRDADIMGQRVTLDLEFTW